MNTIPTSLASNSSSYYWGETVVLFVSTHGSMIKEEYKQSINKFIVPDGITVKRGSISTPGECHYVGFQVSDYFDSVKMAMNELKSNNDEIQNEAMTKIMKGFRRIDNGENNDDSDSMEGQLSELKKKEKKGTLSESEKKDLRYLNSYLIQLPKGYAFDTFSPGEIMVNKVYTRNTKDVRSTRNDMVIKVVENEKGDGIDLMSLLRKKTDSITLRENEKGDGIDWMTLLRNQNDSITLREIVKFLKKKGVKTIIIFDLTCSAILSPDGRHLNETPEGQRTIRSLRREIRNSGWGVGKTKKRRRGKKNKINKIKSRKHRK
jgi:hypothetical protein